MFLTNIGYIKTFGIIKSDGVDENLTGLNLFITYTNIVLKLNSVSLPFLFFLLKLYIPVVLFSLPSLLLVEQKINNEITINLKSYHVKLDTECGLHQFLQQI